MPKNEIMQINWEAKTVPMKYVKSISIKYILINGGIMAPLKHILIHIWLIELLIWLIYQNITSWIWNTLCNQQQKLRYICRSYLSTEKKMKLHFIRLHIYRFNSRNLSYHIHEIWLEWVYEALTRIVNSDCEGDHYNGNR